MINNIVKAVGVLLITYSIVAGLLIPLGTGIVDLSPRIATSGQALALNVTAYNANFMLDSNNLKARLRINKNQALCAERFTYNSPQNIIIHFDLPAAKLPIKTAQIEGKKSPFPLLEINGLENGYTSLESALFIRQADSLAPVSSQLLCNAVEDKYIATDNTTFPFLNILEETIRNLYYHVPMWFAMMFILLLSVIYSIRHLASPNSELKYDHKANSLAAVGVLYGVIGILTGALWAKHTWGSYWSFDVKQNTSAVALLIYFAYFVLRSSFDDLDKKARIAAIYNIFAFATLIPLLYIVPRMVDSLHPGMGGNPAFSKLDLDNTMRMVFYPAIIGWIIIGLWIAEITARIYKLEPKILSK